MSCYQKISSDLETQDFLIGPPLETDQAVLNNNTCDSELKNDDVIIEKEAFDLHLSDFAECGSLNKREQKAFVKLEEKKISN